MSKINIFDVLKNIDDKNYQYFSELSHEYKKKVSMYMLLKWMACSDDPKKLLQLNASVNKWLYELSSYPEILYHTLVACGLGKRDFYKWKKKKPKKITRPITVNLLKEYYDISTQDAIIDSETMDIDSIKIIAEQLGNIDVIKKLQKEYV